MCFKNPESPTYTDLLLTNQPFVIKNTYLTDIGLSDFHKMIVAVMRIHFLKIKPQVVS